MSLLIQADARALPLPDNYVQTVVTSPPYFGLRNYGVAGALGNEPTPEQFVANLVAVFAEVWRVLRDDGTVWLNLGDSYARTGGVDKKPGRTALVGNTLRSHELRKTETKSQTGLKDKDLLGIPWRVAFALQAAGWYLRSDIIWAKPNPMPESVTDRPTRAHEYVFLLTKREKYYYDHRAIMEEAVGKDRRRADQFGGNKHNGAATKHSDGSIFTQASRRNKRSVWLVTPEPFKGAHFATFPQALVTPCLLAGSADWEIDQSRCVVLDPFCGSGTVGLVARQHGRFFIGCDLNPAYLQMARARIDGEREILAVVDKQAGHSRRAAGFNDRWKNRA